jgi:hypothetical protein
MEKYEALLKETSDMKKRAEDPASAEVEGENRELRNE